MESFDLVTAAVGIVGIIATTIVAMYSIRKTAKESRVTSIHTEMLSCLVDTALLFSKLLNYLNEVSQKVVYQSIPDGADFGSAYQRYWQELGNISKKFKVIQAKQRFVFPKEIYKKTQDIIKGLNEARELAKDANPQSNPDTTTLIRKVATVNTTFKEFLNLSRSYIGTQELGPISFDDDLFILSEEEEGSQ